VQAGTGVLTSSTATLYTKDFYTGQIDGSRTAAEIILPIAWEVAGPFRSVADVGCGTGCWLDVARSLGADQIMGFDGEYARECLVIPESCFFPIELNGGPGVHDGGKCDLCISLETAEHLEPESAEYFVEFLTSLSDIVLFSAAIPGQGGTGHINEQWTAYWVKLFRDQEYIPYDVIRPKIWEVKRIPVWYRQNTLLFVNSYNEPASLEYFNPSGMTIVHPELYMARSAFFR
jgi:hypothetical protein